MGIGLYVISPFPSRFAESGPHSYAIILVDSQDPGRFVPVVRQLWKGRAPLNRLTNNLVIKTTSF
jgi:hypothetical protein